MVWSPAAERLLRIGHDQLPTGGALMVVQSAPAAPRAPEAALPTVMLEGAAP
jgi:hypothetical protein